MRMTAKEFVAQHNHIGYCEAIIDKNGMVSYATPSHIEFLIRETKKNRKKITSMIPIFDSPLAWLIKYTGCICIYTNFYMADKINDSQRETLELLLENKLTKNSNIGVF